MPPLKKIRSSFLIEKNGEILSLEELEKEIGFSFIPQLDFADASIFMELQKKGFKTQKRGTFSKEQIWFGSYFREEIEQVRMPPLALRWIDSYLGWGVFAGSDLKKMAFVSEYGGKVRKWKKADQKNSYCFEYVPAQGIETSYTIDASLQGGIGRFINHSDTPNLTSALATIDGISHVIFYAIRPISKGEQLSYDYGPAYWSQRKSPLRLGNNHPSDEIGKQEGSDSRQKTEKDQTQPDQGRIHAEHLP